MKRKAQLDDIDVVFDPTPLTDEERKKISEFIEQDKAKRLSKKSGSTKSRKRIGIYS